MTDNQIIIVIIFGTGILTGTTNYFLTCDLKLNTRENWVKFFASVFLSTCAALTVPLFLQILSNNLLDQASFKNKLIFTGFCILAGFFAKRYLDDLYAKIKNLEKKVDKQEEETDKKLSQTTKDTEAINKKVEDLEESIEEVEPDNISNEIKESLKSNADFSLTDIEVSDLIKSLYSPKYSSRTLSGISKESKIPVEALRPIMEHLKHFGFAETKIGSDGKAYWRLLKYPIKIYSANYGIAGNYTDVTPIINNMISKGDYHGVATQAFLGIDDPAPGILKKLKVHYRIHGKEKDFTVNEGDHFKIE
jgi:uncharacterized protein YoxC